MNASPPGSPASTEKDGAAPAGIGEPSVLTGRIDAVANRFTSERHDTRIAAVLGIALGVAFTTCFVTGLLSHVAQHPPSWLNWPARPAGLYRITQGVHVVTGFAAIPLLLAKLWVVQPRLWTRPAVRNVAHGVERLSLVPLVSGALFMLFSGVANVARWYPYGFYFTSAHFAVAWVTIGALVVHIAAKVGVTRAALARPPGVPDVVAAGAARAREIDRRRFLGGVAATSGIVALAVAGGTVGPLSDISVLAQRIPTTGPQGLPVNKSALAAAVHDAATSTDYRLSVEGAVTKPLNLALDELRGLAMHEATLPITCVEGWSRSAHWRGVRLGDLLATAGPRHGAAVTVVSLERTGRYQTSEVNGDVAADRDTLLALELNGEVLHLDHGFPVRLIAPNRPGVLQTKWVTKVVVR